MAGYKHVTGVREVRDTFKKIKNGLDVPMRTTLQKAARPVLASARRNVPVESGRLKKSLKLWRVPKLPAGQVEYLIGPTRAARLYAHIVEWGKGLAANGTWISRGSRFMTRTFESEREGVVERFKAAWPAELQKRIAYLAKKGRSL